MNGWLQGVAKDECTNRWPEPGIARSRENGVVTLSSNHWLKNSWSAAEENHHPDMFDHFGMMSLSLMMFNYLQPSRREVVIYPAVLRQNWKIPT